MNDAVIMTGISNILCYSGNSMHSIHFWSLAALHFFLHFVTSHCTALCFTALHIVALCYCYTGLCCTLFHYTALYFTALHLCCTVFHYTALYLSCTLLRCTALLLHSVKLHCKAHSCTLLCCTMSHHTLLQCITLSRTLLRALCYVAPCSTTLHCTFVMLHYISPHFVTE